MSKVKHGCGKFTREAALGEPNEEERNAGYNRVWGGVSAMLTYSMRCGAYKTAATRNYNCRLWYDVKWNLLQMLTVRPRPHVTPSYVTGNIHIYYEYHCS